MHRLFIAAAAFGLAACAHHAPAAPQITAQSPHIAAALADARRPQADRDRDANRHAAETLAFAQIAPGARVADVFPGGGYWTRLFAVAVGAEGRVYPTIRPDGVAGQFETPILPIAAEYPNAVMARTAYDALSYPERLDVIFTAQNYHDLAIADYNLGDRAQTNATAFAALRPGGYYVIIDHAAPAGHPLETANQGATHRIDQAIVRAEVEAAGFVFDGESTVLRNPEDSRTVSVFDPSIRGRSDQFMMRFRKPG